MTMKISLFFLPTFFPESNSSPAQLYRDILEEVEFADCNGFGAVWFAEHHFYNYGGMIPSVPVLGVAAGGTHPQRSYRVGRGVNRAQRSRTCGREFAMLDHLSGGRVDFGIGRAFQRAEFDAFEVPME
jgi:alkanesulfonate monooxygenase SsuD/methylene tetrahydromethanopterin reductase-like flavin-dependent oxidoreductase (luciferase family)